MMHFVALNVVVVVGDQRGAQRIKDVRLMLA